MIYIWYINILNMYKIIKYQEKSLSKSIMGFPGCQWLSIGGIGGGAERGDGICH
jgi:hypothetical protein